MIRVNDLTKKFGSFKALKGIDIHVEKNDIYGFLGHNGAGKSTTINILAGLSKMDSGKCIINGVEYSNKLNKNNNLIGYLPEEPCFYSWMTAKEYLLYIGSDYGKNVKKRVMEILDWVGLKSSADRKIGGFSRGMRQRLGMAAALFYDPELLLLDEPSSALDPQGRADFLAMIKKLKEDGKTIFLSTHILDDVERICNKVGIIKAGEMVEEIELSKLMDKYISPIYDIIFMKDLDNEDIKKIEKTEWTENVLVDGNAMTIKVKNESDNCQVYSLIATFKTPVKSVSLRGHSLEQIFIEMTNEEEKNVSCD